MRLREEQEQFSILLGGGAKSPQKGERKRAEIWHREQEIGGGPRHALARKRVDLNPVGRHQPKKKATKERDQDGHAERTATREKKAKAGDKAYQKGGQRKERKKTLLIRCGEKGPGGTAGEKEKERTKEERGAVGDGERGYMYRERETREK